MIADIEKLSTDPRPHGVEMLETREKLYRVYVWSWERLARELPIQDQKLVVLVVRVGDRKEVYRGIK